MRKVLRNHQEVALVWAQQKQSEGKTSDGNVYFEGRTIYSYGSHFALASFQQNSAGRSCILFNSGSYSISTSKHQSHVRRAIGYGRKYDSDVPLFNVPSIVTPYRPEANLHESAFTLHASSLDDYRERISTALRKSSKARTYAAMLKQDAVDTLAEMHAYAEFFNLEGVTFPVIPETLEAIKLAVNAEIAANKIANAERTRQQELFEQEQAQQQRDALAQWMAGETVRRNLHNLPVELRIVGDYVQTSHGAQFPVKDARMGLRLVRRIVASGNAWQRNGETLSLGHYQIDRIAPDGTVKAGCHIVTLAAIERIAPELERAA